MFSATLPDNIMKLSEKYLTHPVRIKIGDSTQPAVNIDHTIIHTDHGNKHDLLLKELHSREGSIIIFVKTKRGAERLAERLEKHHLSADAIHGDLKQSQRDRVIKAFREKKHRIMVATDIAARGLDIPHIEHVINFDLPQMPEDFIHRIGRTARAGAMGSAISLISPDDAGKWREIRRLMDPTMAGSQNEPSRNYEDRPKSSNGNKRRKNFRSRKPSGHGHAQT
jgi:superfamily II DNA/RNA helicase